MVDGSKIEDRVDIVPDLSICMLNKKGSVHTIAIGMTFCLENVLLLCVKETLSLAVDIGIVLPLACQSTCTACNTKSEDSTCKILLHIILAYTLNWCEIS